MTTLPPEPAMPSPLTTRFSPVLVFGTKLISDGLALMSAANCDLTSCAIAALPGAVMPPGRDRFPRAGESPRPQRSASDACTRR